MANKDITQIFATLADPTRRAVVERLAHGPAPVKVLAAPHDMALPSFLKHLEVLERARLIATRKEGRQRICRLLPTALDPLHGWIDRQRQLRVAGGGAQVTTPPAVSAPHAARPNAPAAHPRPTTTEEE